MMNMMTPPRQLEVFFDYACPYCLRAHRYLLELLPQHPDLAVVWRPCEAHPRPDRYGPHSDLCIQGFFFAQAHGADLWAYHERMYKAALQDRIPIEHIDTLAESVRDLLDAAALRQALRQGVYVESLREANRYAYRQAGIRVVPSYRMRGRKLNAIEDIGVTRTQLAAFLAESST